MDEKLIKWMQARVKKGKGSFVPDMVSKCFEHLPGWELKESTAYLYLNNMDGAEKASGTFDVKKFGLKWSEGDSKDPNEIWSRDKDQAAMDKALQWLKTNAKKVAGKKPKTPSGKAKAKTLYITEPAMGPRK